MRLCYLGNANTIHARRLLKGFTARGIECLAVSDQFAEIEGVSVQVVPPWQSLRQLWGVQKEIIASIRPDVIHANFIDPFATITQWLSTPTILTPWGSDVYAPFPDRFSGINRFIKWQLLRRTYRRADFVTALNAHMQECLCTRFGVAPERVLQFRLGIPSPVEVSVDQCRQLRDERGADTETLVYFSSRACRPLYNVLRVVEGFQRAFTKGENVQLWVSTFGADEDYLRTIEDLSSCDNRVCFIPPVSHNEMSILISAADVSISVPDSDGLPVTVMQSLAQGRPVIFKELPQLADLVSNGEHGVSVKAADAVHLANAMATVYVDRSALTEMQQRCLKRFNLLPTEHEELDKLVSTFAGLVER